MKKALKISLIYIASTLILFEVIGLFIGENGFYGENRNLFITQGAFRGIGDDGLWTYQPNMNITTAATYHLSKMDKWVEYRCDFETDSYGLIKTNLPEDSETVDYLILGDSFTEGHGGCPWITAETLKDVSPTLLNGGLQSNGIVSFALLEEWLASQIDIKNVIIIAIPHDFRRMPRPNRFQGDLPCENFGKCEADHIGWWGIDNNLTHDELLEISSERYSSKNPSLSDQVHDTLRYRSFTYQLFEVFKQRFFGKPRKENPKLQSKYDANFSAISKLNQKYAGLKLILVTQKDEAGLFGRPNTDNRISQDYLREAGIDYSVCELRLRDFMKIDSHPNEKGYQKLFECLMETIDG